MYATKKSGRSLTGFPGIQLFTEVVSGFGGPVLDPLYQKISQVPRHRESHTHIRFWVNINQPITGIITNNYRESNG